MPQHAKQPGWGTDCWAVLDPWRHWTQKQRYSRWYGNIWFRSNIAANLEPEPMVAIFSRKWIYEMGYLGKTSRKMCHEHLYQGWWQRKKPYRNENTYEITERALGEKLSTNNNIKEIKNSWFCEITKITCSGKKKAYLKK